MAGMVTIRLVTIHSSSSNLFLFGGVEMNTEIARHKSIDMIISNLIMADLLTTDRIPFMMTELNQLDDGQLALALIDSKIRLNDIIEAKGWLNRDYYTDKDTYIKED